MRCGAIFAFIAPQRTFNQFFSMNISYAECMKNIYTDAIKDTVRTLYLKRYLVSEIERKTHVPRRTIYDWIRKNYWDDLLNSECAQTAMTRRLTLLVSKDTKNDIDLRELEMLLNASEKLKRKSETKQQKSQAQETEDTAEKPDNSSSQKKKKGKKKKNDFTGLTQDEIEAPFLKLCKEYQLEMYNERHHRLRQYLKSRQIGMTYEVAGEILVDALLTGRNKVCISGSKAQVEVIKDYVKIFADDWFDVDLKGSGDKKIEIVSDFGRATLYFLSTNSKTAQSYHGDLYIDEYFWIPKFDELNKLASAIATHKQYRKTYFSTPSTKSHPAYKMWVGENHQSDLRRANKPAAIFPSNKELEKGLVWEDGIFRKVITIHNAIAKGADFFDVEQLKKEYSDDVFKQLFECKFIDDSLSAFKFSLLEKCITDQTRWSDFDSSLNRPFGNVPVWIGYDPSRLRDNSSIVVLAPPIKSGGVFRVLEKITLNDKSWAFQAEKIKELTEKYNVEHIGIDSSGCGHAVYESVKSFYPRAKPIVYGLESKSRLVLKAQDVIEHNRIQWDAEHSDIAASFMSIKTVMTKSDQITYKADRSAETGHADAAWAIMHALSNESLNYRTTRKSRYVFQ